MLFCSLVFLFLFMYIAFFYYCVHRSYHSRANICSQYISMSGCTATSLKHSTNGSDEQKKRCETFKDCWNNTDIHEKYADDAFHSQKSHRKTSVGRYYYDYFVFLVPVNGAVVRCVLCCTYEQLAIAISINHLMNESCETSTHFRMTWKQSISLKK